MYSIEFTPNPLNHHYHNNNDIIIVNMPPIQIPEASRHTQSTVLIPDVDLSVYKFDSRYASTRILVNGNIIYVGTANGYIVKVSGSKGLKDQINYLN